MINADFCSGKLINILRWYFQVLLGRSENLPYPDQLPIRQLITNQAQDGAFPAWQTDGPITGQTKTRCGGCLWHRKALQVAIADPFFEAHHKMRTPIQQGGQKRKAEVPAIKDGGPVPGPLQGRRSFQIVHLAGRDHPLLRDPRRRAHSKTACILATPLCFRYLAQRYANSDSLIRLASTTAIRANFRPIRSSHGPYVIWDRTEQIYTTID